jgi:uncharacterized membrane protein
MIDLSVLVHLLVWIIIVGCIFGLLWWLIGYVGLPEPFNKIARIAVAVIAVLVLINVLLGFVGATPLVHLR